MAPVSDRLGSGAHTCVCTLVSTPDLLRLNLSLFAQEQLEFRPDREQSRFLGHEHQHNCTRQWGKSTVAAFLGFFWQSMPGPWGAFASEPRESTMTW